jgi:hypothetical protein
MNVTQIRAKIVQHALTALMNTPVPVQLVTQEQTVKKTLMNVTQSPA